LLITGEPPKQAEDRKKPNPSACTGLAEHLLPRRHGLIQSFPSNSYGTGSGTKEFSVTHEPTVLFLRSSEGHDLISKLRKGNQQVLVARDQLSAAMLDESALHCSGSGCGCPNAA